MDVGPIRAYIDGIDQTGFLLADNGESTRRSRPYTLNQYFAMMRVDEFNYISPRRSRSKYFACPPLRWGVGCSLVS